MTYPEFLQMLASLRRRLNHASIARHGNRFILDPVKWKESDDKTVWSELFDEWMREETWHNEPVFVLDAPGRTTYDR